MLRRLAIGVFGLWVFSVGSQAQVPRVIHYQGRLLNRVTGEPEQGLFSFRFRLMNTPQGEGVEYWSELHQAQVGQGQISEPVLVEDGYYQVELGKYNPIPAQIFSATEVYLEVQVLPDPPMTPRQRLFSVPYAFEADLLDGKDGREYLDVASFIAHASNPNAHHRKTTDASEILSGVFQDARIPGTVARKTDLQPFVDHLNDFNNPHKVTLEQAARDTSHDSLRGARGFLSHSSIDAHIKGLVASATTPLYDHACPSSMAQVGYSCMDKQLFRDSGQTQPLTAGWFDAALKCASQKKRLCTPAEWYVGCLKSSELAITEIGVEKEWIDLWAPAGQDPLGAVTAGLGGCGAAPRRENSPTLPMRFRCCR